MNPFLYEDIAYLVSNQIKDSQTWLSFSLINKLCAKVSHKNQKNARKRLSNHLLILLKKYPNKPWNWYGLSCNPNITWEIVQNNPNKPWSWDGLSFNQFNQNGRF